MKFYGEPNLLIRPRKNGRFKRLRPFRFDQNGEFETDNPLLINALSKKFKTEKENDEYTEEELREMAKEKGIKSWHVKSIEKLKSELGL